MNVSILFLLMKSSPLMLVRGLGTSSFDFWREKDHFGNSSMKACGLRNFDAAEDVSTEGRGFGKA